MSHKNQEIGWKYESKFKNWLKLNQKPLEVSNQLKYEFRYFRELIEISKEKFKPTNKL